MTGNIPRSWHGVLAPVLAQEPARRLGNWLRLEEASGKTIFPPHKERLRALELTPRDEVRVVILGQDPYHGPGQAHGLAFSVPETVRIPPSLANIYKELRADLGMDAAANVHPASGNLEHWARQGVLLLNNALTVEAGQAGSHAGKGWEAITDAIVAAVAERSEPCVFMLWGSHAQAKAARIAALQESAGHCLIRSPHPSPLSAHRGFFGSRPFSKANAFLAQHGRGTIDWV